MTLKTFCAFAAVMLLANTAYIAAAASPTVFYMGNVLAHVVLGAALWVAALGLLARDRELRGSRPVQLAFVGLTVAAAFSAELMRRGNLLEVRWVLIAHIAAGAIATAALVPLAWRLAARGAGGARRFGVAYHAGAALLVVTSRRRGRVGRDPSEPRRSDRQPIDRTALDA